MSAPTRVPAAQALRRFVRVLILAAGIGSASAAELAPVKDPLAYPLKQYLFILALSLLGGLAGWYNKVRKGQLAATNLMALIGELCTSALSGLLAFYLCEYMNLAPVLTAAAVGVAGHMGTRGINWIEDHLKRKVDSSAGQDRT